MKFRTFRGTAQALVLACCAPTFALCLGPAQSTFFQEKWTAADGLPSSSIAGIARAGDGSLWVGTANGLARFDGARFEKLPYNLSGRIIDYVAAGPDSQMYVGTWQGGLMVIRDRQMRVFGSSQGLLDMRVLMVLPVGDDEAYVSTISGALYRYIDGSIRKTACRLASGDSIYGLTRTHDGTIWIGASSGLYLLRGSRFERYQPKIPLPVTAIFDLATIEDGSVFAASDRGLFRISGDVWQSWTTKQGLPSDRVQVLAASSRNRLWIGTVAGPALLDDGKVESFKDCVCSISSLLAEQDGSAWFGCSDAKGLHRLRHRAVNLLTVSGPVSEMPLTSLVEDRTGTVWMASPHGLVRWRNGRTIVYTRKDGLPTDDIYSVFLAPDDSVWLATEDGFAKLKNGRFQTFRTPHPTADDPIDSILEDRQGTLWVGTARGLLRRARDEPELRRVPEVKGDALSLREGRAGNIWVGTYGSGLFRFSANGFTRYTQRCGLASDVVADVVEVDDGSFWVATDKGLSRIRDGRCATLRAEKGLSPGAIFGIGYDGQGHLWLKTEGGVLVLDIAQANRAIDGCEGPFHPRFLSRYDDFGEELTDVMEMNSVVHHSSGEMWFAMSNGIGRVSPEVLRTAMPEIHPEVTRVSSDRGEHDLTQPLVMEPGDLRLQFSYGAPALIGGKSLQFRYRLARFDDAWQVGGESRNATYTSLPPGSYQFQVSARRPFEPWTELAYPIEIRVLPHFYQTWWWFTLLAFAFFSLTYFLYRRRLLTVRKQNAALMTERLRERAVLARELHDTLSQGMLGIHIQIEAAQQLLEENPQAVHKHLENVGRIAREASLDTRRSIETLRSQEIPDLSLRCLLKQIANKFETDCDIPLTKNIADNLPNFSSEISHEIARIVEEALANVRSHSGARSSSLSASTAERDVVFEVQDDGPGFETGTAGRGRFGLLGMRERALNIHSKLRISSAPGKGTSVVLEVPFHPSLNRQIFFRGHSLLALGKRLFMQNGAQRRE